MNYIVNRLHIESKYIIIKLYFILNQNNFFSIKPHIIKLSKSEDNFYVPKISNLLFSEYFENSDLTQTKLGTF